MSDVRIFKGAAKVEHGVTSLVQRYANSWNMWLIKISKSEVYLHVKVASLTLIWLRKALPRPCPSLAPFTKPAMSVTLRKAGTCRWSQKYDNIWGFSVRKCKYHRWLPCWQACGAQLTNPNAHQERPPEPSQYWYFPQMCYQYITSLGSIVQKGKFSAAAWLLLVNTLKKVD